jgi:hypothetical protein
VVNRSLPDAVLEQCSTTLQQDSDLWCLLLQACRTACQPPCSSHWRYCSTVLYIYICTCRGQVTYHVQRIFAAGSHTTNMHMAGSIHMHMPQTASILRQQQLADLR